MQAGNAYKKVVQSLKRRKNGATAADVCAATALPLATVRELLPKAADEYSGHLQVTQSGEILYTFPAGFTSRIRGFRVGFKRFTENFSAAVRAAFVFFFKVWIMVMLIGYFILFLALAAASVFISVSAKSSSNRGRRGGISGFNMFGLLWRIWFYSELTKPCYGYRSVTRKEKPRRPMHKAVFSFVFGEEDTDADWEDRESRAVIAYIQSNRGVISLAEYMAFTGKNSMEAEEAILAFCAKFGGSPEVTEEGTIVYRFDDLLLRADSKDFAQFMPPVKRLKIFSANPKKMNGWFIVINAVNLIFGSYFLYQSFTAQPSYLYALMHYYLQQFTLDPASIIRVVLGCIPLVFSVLFWLIPAVRFFMLEKENDGIKLGNFMRLGFSKIWQSPNNVETGSLIPSAAECRPKNLTSAGDRVIKDIGAFSIPEIENGEKGETIYSFRELEREKHALEKYRANIDPSRAQLGETVFDSNG